MRPSKANPSDAPVRHALRTTCGRELAVGRLRLSGLDHPVTRVTLEIGCQPYDRDAVWASLTAAEARRLAARLLAQAAAIEREGR
ncbi:MAG: hypothetical protein GEV03_23195 [Streptosporangiales bacterium]|nr:hypothetical protein [Streptosporangiales bacterium]